MEMVDLSITRMRASRDQEQRSTVSDRFRCSNPYALAWWHSQMDYVLDIGLDGWKCDGTRGGRAKKIDHLSLTPSQELIHTGRVHRINFVRLTFFLCSWRIGHPNRLEQHRDNDA
jgi:hypothetical protein